MKFFAFIMAIVIMAVSCAPCRDSSSVVKVTKSSQEFHAKAADHDHEDGPDDCSPLCTCACCSAHSCPQSFVSAVSSAPEINIDHFSAYSGSLISISLPIWQPPQLVA